MKRILTLALALAFLLIAAIASAQDAVPIPRVNIDVGQAQNPEEVATSLQILGLLTILSLAPALLIMTTAFTRIVIVFSFLRTALGTPTIPPNQVIIGLSLFLTFFVMSPTLSKLNDEALQPYMKKEVSLDVAKERAWSTMREFMFRQTYKRDLALFAGLSGVQYETLEDVRWQELVPAFILSEIKTAFVIGFYIFIPFLVIDLVVASTLMSMGMMMLPPAIVSLPAKILVFLLADGWSVIVQALAGGFR
jgi:flagellar biosynthetic protein FliP